MFCVLLLFHMSGWQKGKLEKLAIQPFPPRQSQPPCGSGKNSINVNGHCYCSALALSGSAHDRPSSRSPTRLSIGFAARFLRPFRQSSDFHTLHIPFALIEKWDLYQEIFKHCVNSWREREKILLSLFSGLLSRSPSGWSQWEYAAAPENGRLKGGKNRKALVGSFPLGEKKKKKCVCTLGYDEIQSPFLLLLLLALRQCSKHEDYYEELSETYWMKSKE